MVIGIIPECRSAFFRNSSDFVQIPLSQVPRRDTVGSTRLHGAGALVDRELRYFANCRTDLITKAN